MKSPDTTEYLDKYPLSVSGETSAQPNSAPNNQPPEHEHHEFEWTELGRIVFVVVAAAAVWLRPWEPFPRISVIGILATLIGGYPIFKEAIENTVERKMTMELSMTIALLAALAIGEFFTALVITAFVLAAEVLEGLTVGRGRKAIQSLLDFLPKTVTVRRNGTIAEITANELHLRTSRVQSRFIPTKMLIA